MPRLPRTSPLSPSLRTPPMTPRRQPLRDAILVLAAVVVALIGTALLAHSCPSVACNQPNSDEREGLQ